MASNEGTPQPGGVSQGGMKRSEPDSVNVVTRKKLRTLMDQLEPRVELEPEVEEMLLAIADDFVESVTQFSCTLARHRGSETLEAKDVRLHLERNWGIHVTGFGPSVSQVEVNSAGNGPRTDVPEKHRKRLLLVRAAQRERRPKLEDEDVVEKKE